MRTPASIFHHPIHPMLIVFPIGLWFLSETELSQASVALLNRLPAKQGIFQQNRPDGAFARVVTQAVGSHPADDHFAAPRAPASASV